MEGKFGNAVVKATYGGQIRKWKLDGGSTFADLVNEVRSEFGVDLASLQLKYKDSDGDLIELASDEDLALAIESERKLVIVASHELDDLPKSVAEFRASLTTLIANATDLYNSLDNLSLPEKKSNVITTRDAVSSPVKSEPIATIDPSVLEEVQLNDLPNGIVQEIKPSYDNGIQSFQPIKNAQLDGQGYGQHPPSSGSLPPSAHPASFGQQYQASAPPTSFGQPPVSNYAQQPLAQQAPPIHPGQQTPVNNYGQQYQPPSSNYGQQSLAQQTPPAHPGQQTLNSAPLPPVSSPSQPLAQQFPASGPLPPSSNYGQQYQPPSSNYGQQYQPQQQQFPAPPTGFGLPPTFYPGQQNPAGNPFQRPSTTPNNHQ